MTQAHSLNILCAGECMLELRSQGEQFVPGFAGDVVNFAIYLKRLSPASTVHFLSAVGTDRSSDKMRRFLDKAGLDTRLVFSSPDKTIGLYLVDTDASGERSFSYWRSDSAARQMLSLADTDKLDALARDTEYFYFSGITLAILDQEGRDRLLSFAAELRGGGKKIVFDPNYRAILWPSLERAREEISRTYELTDMLLTSCEDEQLLFGTRDKQTSIERLRGCGIQEVVMTDGAAAATAIYQGRQYAVTPQQAERVVDTTAAGDSFKAGYIAARHSGTAPDIAMARASVLSARVVSYPGAIIPEMAMP